MAAASIVAAASAGFSVHDVVWYRVGSGYPHWPCKVVEIDEYTISIQSFGDDHLYPELSLKGIVSFTDVDMTMTYITKGRKKLKNHNDSLKLFNKSLVEAVIAIKEKNPQFTLEDDTVTSIMNIPIESSPVAPATDDNTVVSRFGRTVKTQNTPTNESSQKKKPRSRKKKDDREGSVGAGPPSQGSDLAEDSPTLVHDLFQQSINRLSAKRANRKRCLDTSPSSLAKKRYDGNSSDVEEAININSSQESEEDYSAISISLSDKLLQSPPPQEEHVNSITISDPLDNDIDTNIDCGVSPLSVSKESISDDELLPATHGLRDTELKFADLKPNDLIWVKFLSYPYWPSIVASIQTKTKRAKNKIRLTKPQTKILVYFLGVVDDADKPFSISKEANIASYSYSNRQRLIDQGRIRLKGKSYAEQFEQAVEEADEFIHMRRRNEISGTPREQIELLIEKRQSFIEDFLAAKDKKIKELKNQTNTEDDSQPAVLSAFGFAIQQDLFSNDDDQSDSDGEWEEQKVTDSDHNSSYGFNNILRYLEENKALLVDISKGNVYSELHQTFCKGLQKERGRLKLTEKFGPVKLSKTEETDVLSIIQEAVKGTFKGMNNFSYAYDVLLPEVVVRMINQQEECSLEEAWDRFNNF